MKNSSDFRQIRWKFLFCKNCPEYSLNSSSEQFLKNSPEEFLKNFRNRIFFAEFTWPKDILVGFLDVFSIVIPGGIPEQFPEEVPEELHRGISEEIPAEVYQHFHKDAPEEFFVIASEEFIGEQL